MTTRSMWRPGLDIPRIRRHTEKMDARLGRGANPMPTEQVTVAGVPALWFGAPELARNGTLLYLHGGAWCLHLPNIYRRFATRLCELTGMRVLLPDYRLAPEHAFPAGIDDCLAAYRWMVDEGYPQRPFALAGDSAGGSLALVTMMRARDAGLPMPDCAALLSPSTDVTMSGPSVRYNAEADPIFSPAAVDLLPSVYCQGQDLGKLADELGLVESEEADVALALGKFADEVGFAVDLDLQKVLFAPADGEHLLAELDVGRLAEDRLENQILGAAGRLGETETDINAEDFQVAPPDGINEASKPLTL
jgi:acetyl esterase/lipase